MYMKKLTQLFWIYCEKMLQKIPAITVPIFYVFDQKPF